MKAPDGDQVVTFAGDRLTLGSSNSNDVVLDDVNVSRFHAEVVPVGGELELRDLNSRCGTRLDGRPVKRSILQDGARIGVGPFDLVFDGSRFVGRSKRGALRLEARDVAVRADGRDILRETSLAVEPGELVAVIGASGSGKTTLLKALAGVITPTSGRVALNDEPVTSRLTDIGFVPQDEIVHGALTVREALRYAARLRLPRDADRREVEATIDRVLSELSLEHRATTRVARLSGGERKRASVAVELLGRPSLLFLDEPTTGLDPALEAQLMKLFRSLAEPGVRSVVLVTHATKSLAICDRLAVLAPGGELLFFGPRADALAFFEVDFYDDIYVAVESRPAKEWRRAFEARRRPAPAPPEGAEDLSPGPAGAARAKQRTGPQLGTLVSRYARLFLRDPRNLAILLGQVPVIALAIAFLFPSGLFARAGSEPGDPREGVQLLFLLVTTAIWFGSIDGAREIVKERAVLARETAIGVRVSTYLASKVIVLSAVAAAQTLVLTYFVLALRPLDEPASAYLAVSALLVLVSLVGVATGLLVSAAVRTEDQATSFIPLTLIPQLLLAGAIVAVEKMTEPMASISLLAAARWALAGVGGVVDMDARLAVEPRLAEAAGFGDFFDIPAGDAAGILLAFLAVTLVATYGVLKQRAS